MQVRFVTGGSDGVGAGEHRVVVDRPGSGGGEGDARTPAELFVAALATCVAFYAGRYLDRHGFGRDGLRVSVDWAMASDQPARVASVLLTVRVLADLQPDQRRALLVTASSCTVHHSLTHPPTIVVSVA